MVPRVRAAVGKGLAAACAGVVLTTTAVLSGCGRADGGAAADGPAAVRAAGTMPRELTPAEQAVVERGEERLIESCMREKGFRYWAGRVAGAAERQGHGYVLHDVDWAERHGYGGRFAAEAEKARLADRNTAYARSLPRAELIRYNTALDGTPEQGVVSVELPAGGTVQTVRGGCLETAAERLYGDFPAWFRAKKTATGVAPLYTPGILADERFRRALRAWASCMREAGHPYAGPPEIREKLPALTRGMDAAEAHAAEVELAVAEATCATGTPLYRTARALDREYRAEKLGRYRDEIAAHRRMGLTALKRARALPGAAG
ncbi:hypothetical protein ACH437_11680 [Streptomyces xinghaiensis]|uniref:hypothetical protein n=1 Tax=Streptomyces xinghaiensis TaxID=1038928 RepID=UPI0037AC0823